MTTTVIPCYDKESSVFVIHEERLWIPFHNGMKDAPLDTSVSWYDALDKWYCDIQLVLDVIQGIVTHARHSTLDVESSVFVIHEVTSLDSVSQRNDIMQLDVILRRYDIFNCIMRLMQSSASFLAVIPCNDKESSVFILVIPTKVSVKYEYYS